MRIVLILAVGCLSAGWIGQHIKPLAKKNSDLAQGASGTYYQLSDAERKELVWMAKAANAAYPDGEKPLGYRSFTRMEWDACSANCSELVYTEDGYFNVGSGLRGRLMVHMVDEGRVVLALSGCDFNLSDGPKDFLSCLKHYFCGTPDQYRQALRLMTGVLGLRPRSHLWIVGHSLGGSLTAYLTIEIPESRTCVKCATFNGYGLSPFSDVTVEKEKLAAIRLRNVYCDGDPIYNLGDILLKTPFLRRLPPPRHYGPSYSLVGRGGPIAQHSLDGLLKLMIAHRTRWQGI